jgi:septal ring factor EnvC (AmiA/AmiB activator)
MKLKQLPAEGGRISVRVFVLLCICFLLLPRELFSQEAPSAFTSIDSDLLQLENLINDTLLNMETQQQQLEDLKRNLNESEELIGNYESIINEREQSLKELQSRLAAMLETYKQQSALSARYARSSKFWKIFTLIAVPAAAGLGVATGLAIR